MKNELVIFEKFKIRRHYDEKKETWFFSVIDIVAALTGQIDYNKAKTYWTTLKNRLKNEGSEVVTKCDQLKMLAQDGKMRETDVANAETVKAKGMEENKIAGKKGGGVAKRARIDLEHKTGKQVVSGKNFLPKTLRPPVRRG